ncbi:MAG: thiamine-phosphate kinase [Pyrinomonadaceae bacterium]
MRSEFDFIQSIKNKYGLTRVGDDCAVLPKDDKTDLVVTTDMLVEDIDFRLDWTLPEFLGHKALAVSLSDIAAMGATPKWSVLSMGVPESIWNSSFLDDFYSGWHKLADRFSIELVGGDISRTPNKIVIDSMVGGEVAKGEAVLRSGAQIGDVILVTGTLGGAAGGLQLLRSGSANIVAGGTSLELIDRQLRPSPPVSWGEGILVREGVSAMIDISDGLSSDLAHICVASGVGARIYEEKIPIDPNLFVLDKSHNHYLELALHGGEDFELLFTVDEKKLSAFNSPVFTIIGEVTATIGIIELIRDGKTEILQPKGYRHF